MAEVGAQTASTLEVPRRGGVATFHRTTLYRTTVKRRQFIGRQLTGATVIRSDT